MPPVPPLQQPFGHVLASQTQTPLIVSQSPLGHAAHVAPPLPHSERDWAARATQVLPLQQPLGQDVTSQTHCPVALLHSCPVAHAPQIAPAAPHEAFDSDA